MKILVFGTSGQVALELQKVSETSPHSFVFLGRDEADLTQVATLKIAVEKHSPKAVINAAAYTAVDRAEEEVELAYAVNAAAAVGNARCLECCRRPDRRADTGFSHCERLCKDRRKHQVQRHLSLFGQP